jgi:hypothetical protein
MDIVDEFDISIIKRNWKRWRMAYSAIASNFENIQYNGEQRIRLIEQGPQWNQTRN